jgi:uncharacterized repeat protein (TIGR03803 family)
MILARSALGCGMALGLFASWSGAYAAGAKVLYAFKGGANGENPYGGVISDKAGNLYGTTSAGGSVHACHRHGCGTIYKVAPDGTQTTLYTFNGGSDGAQPLGLVLDGAGNLFGATEDGGDPSCGKGNCGTVFKLTPDGTKTILHNFEGGSDGIEPWAGLLLGKDGNLYGTTSGGGIQNGGIVFKISPGGAETVLYSFCSQSQCMDGGSPVAALISDKAGNLYGTTLGGGTTGWGTVFKLATNGAETVLYSFCGVQDTCEDGAQPYAGVTMDASGNLYGTTEFGGEYNFGTIFKVDQGGNETVLHSFFPPADGGSPEVGVILDKAGNLYGTAPFGPCNGKGSPAYKLSTDSTLTISCVPASLNSGLTERNGVLYGTGVYGFKNKYRQGIVFALKE